VPTEFTDVGICGKIQSAQNGLPNCTLGFNFLTARQIRETRTKILLEYAKGEMPLSTSGHGWENNIKMNLKLPSIS